MEAVSFAGQRYVRKQRFECDLSNCTLVELLNNYQEHQRKRIVKFSVQPIVNTILSFQTFIGGDLYPGEVTDLFYDDFVPFLFARSLKANTVNKYLCNLTSALKYGAKHNVKLSSTFDEFTIDKNAPVKPTLTADEVSYIYHFDVWSLPFRPNKLRRLERIRDAFVLQCNLYQRFSDMCEIDKSNFVNGIFTRRTQKTDIISIVDINHETISPEVTFEILEKYNYKFPYSGNINNYNLGIHELLMLIGGSFNDMVIIEERHERKVVKVGYHKYELISSHSARHTAATLATKRGMSEVKIKKCLGHSMGSYTIYRYTDFMALR